LTTVEPDEHPLAQANAGEPAPGEHQPATIAETAVEQPTSFVVRPTSPHQQDVLFVPLAVNVGDGFKFGCGFFLALVLAMLIGFVLVAALLVLTGLFGLNLPLTR